jgi:hypothetical protein
MEDGQCTKLVKQCNITWTTLNACTNKLLEDSASTILAKTGKPHVMPPDLQIIIVSYTISTEDLASGLTFSQAKRVAFKVVEVGEINYPFNRKGQMAHLVLILQV